MVAAAVVVPIVLTSGDEEQATTASTQDKTGEASSLPKETWTPRPKDRDPAAVTAAMRQLDPCQLLDLEVARQRQVPNAVTIPTGPHACVLVPRPDFWPLHFGLHLVVGTFSDQFRRYSETPIVLAGAKAYEYSRQSETSSRCQVVIPVSFVRAIELSYQQDGNIELCPAVRQYAEATVTKLHDPDTVAFRDTTRPFTAWDACSLLERLVGETSVDYTYEPNDNPKPGEQEDPLSGCVAKDEPDDEGGAHIKVRYGQQFVQSRETRQIGGKAVAIGSNGGLCAATWDHGPSGSPNPEYATTIVSLSGTDCDAAAMAERAITLAGQRPDDVEPHRPLLFGPDDNDTGSVGACVDFGATGGQEDCEPYQEVPVPSTPDDILAAANANRHVQCAVFSDAVQATFGEQFAPITWGAHCYFVDPDHTVEIRVNVDPDNPPSSYGVDPSLWTEPEEIEIAGKQAVTFWDTDRNTFEIYLSPHDDIGQPGNLHIAVQMIGGRGKEIDVSPELPEDRAGLATEVMSKVVETYFR